MSIQIVRFRNTWSAMPVSPDTRLPRTRGEPNTLLPRKTGAESSPFPNCITQRLPEAERGSRLAERFFTDVRAIRKPYLPSSSAEVGANLDLGQEFSRAEDVIRTLLTSCSPSISGSISCDQAQAQSEGLAPGRSFWNYPPAESALRI